MLSLLSSSPAASDLWIRQSVSAYTGKGGADTRLVTSNLVVLRYHCVICFYHFLPLSKSTTISQAGMDLNDFTFQISR